MFSHATVAVHDFGRAHDFYNALLPVIGLFRSFYEPDRAMASFSQEGHARPLFFVTLPFEGEAEPGNGPMIAFLCETRDLVDKVHETALDLGASDEGAPGLREDYHPNFYGCYIRDPEGNKVCFVCHAADQA